MKEHKRSVIGNHVREQHGNELFEIAKNFRVLRKCSNKFDCLIFEIIFIRDLKEARIVSPFFQSNKHILSLDTVRVIISRRNLARVLSIHHRVLTLHFPPK